MPKARQKLNECYLRVSTKPLQFGYRDYGYQIQMKALLVFSVGLISYSISNLLYIKTHPKLILKIPLILHQKQPHISNFHTSDLVAPN